MSQVRSSLEIALLVATALVGGATPSRAATDPGPAQPVAPANGYTRNSAVYVPAAPAAEAPKAAAGEAKAPAADAVKAGAASNLAGEPGVVEVTKLKHQIKATRLSLADTQGRLAVTEKDLANATGENTQLRADGTNLRVGLAKAETVAKKSEEELGLRRQEVRTLQTARHSGWGMLVFVLALSLVTVGMLAAVLFRHGSRLRTILERLQDANAVDRRLEQLRAELKEEQERSRRLADERLRAPTVPVVADSQAPSQTLAPLGSKREKLEHVRRELRQVEAAAAAEKRQSAERIGELEAELARATADRHALEQRLRALEPELAALATAKQELVEQLGKLAPESARLASERSDAEVRARELSRDVARLTAEKLRLQLALSKANERLAFFGYDEPEDTLPPVVG